MLSERSSSTSRREPEDGSARSSTGMASSHTSAASAAMRNRASVRRVTGESGGSRNEYAHSPSATPTSEASTSQNHGALGARWSAMPLTLRG